MSDLPNTGGFAFPIPFPMDAPTTHTYSLGMTLRDWFAGQALNGLSREFQSTTEIVNSAYAFADAMLERRKR